MSESYPRGRTSTPAWTGRGVEILNGELSEVSLVALLQLCQWERISGWVHVDRRGTITLSEGAAVAATCGALTQVLALRELLFHRGGTFSLHRGEVPTRAPLESVICVAMDAYRLRDEWQRIAHIHLRPAGGRPWTPRGADFDAIVARLQRGATLEEAVTESDAPWTTALEEALEAIAGGHLERVKGAKPAPTAATAGVTALLDFDALVDRGRELMRRGNYEAAEGTLLRALALRPDDRVVQQNLRVLTIRLRGE